MRKLLSLLLILLLASNAEAALRVPLAGGGSWGATGTWDGGVVPANGDDVKFTATGGSVVVNVSTTNNLKSFDMTGYTATMSGTGPIVVVGSSATNPVVIAGALSWSGTLNLNPTGTTSTTADITLDSGGKTLSAVTMNGQATGQVVLISNSTVPATGTVTLTRATFRTDGLSDGSGYTHSWGIFNSTGTNNRTLNLGNSNITVTSAAGNPWQCDTSTNLTVTPGNSIITFSGASAIIRNGSTTGAKNYNHIAFSGGGTVGISSSGGGASYNYITATGTNVKTDIFVAPVGMTINNGIYLSGNSAINRLLVRSGTLGTQYPITVTSATYSIVNCDFRDISLSSGAVVDLSTTSGNSGDCGGNSNMTFTSPVTQTWDGSTANWDTAARWTSRVPLPQDNVVLAGTNTCTANMPRLGKDISFSGACKLTLGNAVTSYGSLDLTGMGTFSGGQTWNLESGNRSGTNTLTSAGKSFPGSNTFATYGTTLSLADAFTCGNATLVTAGTLLDNGNNLTTLTFNTNSGSVTRVVTKTGNWTVSYYGNIWDAGGSGSSWSDTAGTISLTNNSTNSKTFAGQSRTYSNLSISSGGSGAVILSGSNTFNNITVNAPKTLTLTGSTTQTLNSLTATGASGSTITLNAPTLTTTPPILTKATNGPIQTDYLNIQGVNVTPSATWYYGNNSVDGLGLNFGGQTSSGDYVSAANSATANQFFGSTAYSIEAWVVARTAGASNVGMPFEKRTSSNTGVQLRMGSGNNFYINADFSGGSNIASGAKIVTLNTLTHLVGVWNGSQLIGYVNASAGTETATSGTPLDDSSLTANIGNRAARDTTWDGTIYAVRIYRNVALTQANVTALYNAGVKAINPLGTATSEYLFNDGTGATLTDRIAAVNGTITGADWCNTGWLPGNKPDNAIFMIGD